MDNNFKEGPVENLNQASSPVTIIISEVIQEGMKEVFEQWAREINDAVENFNGLLSVEVIRPRDESYLEYVTIIRFDNYDNLKIWQTSDVCKKLIKKSQKFILKKSGQQKSSGLELWFTLPTKFSRVNKPAYYKMVIIGILAVYPLILLMDFLLGPYLKELDPLLGLLISVSAISALLTYPVMPFLTYLLRFWLYPSESGEEEVE